jgi:uncharacterized phiE125 gp8 family phage protein
MTGTLDYSLTLITPPSEEPVSLTGAKLYLRVDHEEDDDLIRQLISAARRVAERITGRQLVTATWEYRRDRWPASSFMRLPRPPVRTVESVTYLDTSGTLQTLDSSLYEVDTGRNGLWLAYLADWPALRDTQNAVRVRFTAGYGAASEVPETIYTAILLLVSEWYERRLPADKAGTTLPVAVQIALENESVIDYP